MGWFGKKKDETEAAPVAEPELTIARSRNEMQLRTEANIGLWGIDEASWDADITAGTIVFRNAKGQKIVAPMQIVGTYNTEDGTWLWGWDHPSVPEPIGEHARLAREFGERYGLGAYTTRKIECDRDLAWEFTAVACHLGGGQGGYSGPSGPTLVFMTFGTVTIGAA